MRIHVSGIDLIRDEHGGFRVLEDNVRVPSGVSYVLANRRAMARRFPELFAASGCGRSATTRASCSRALRAARRPAWPTRPSSCSRPGVFNSAYFEHTLLARQMGVELVEGRDLFCRDDRVYMRTTAGTSGST